MEKPKGGRGHTAPYQTTHLRIPVELKPKLEQIVNDYKDATLKGIEYSEKKHLDIIKAIKLAKQILKSKKSAKFSLAKLLTSLYSVEIKPESLED